MNILVIRFSALGDVVMTVPVIHSVATCYPQHHFIVLSRTGMASYFENLPSNVQFKGVDLNQYKGIWGLGRLYQELKSLNIDAVADLHDVLRSQYLRFRFLLAGQKVCHIHKGRAEKRALTSGDPNKHRQLRTSFERYADVFAELGLPVSVSYIPSKISNPGWIGIAPFAAHAGKVYPHEKMKEVIRRISQHADTRIFLFGGGAREVEMLESWAQIAPNVESVAGKLDRKEELKLISELKVMLSMDSANMHLASLMGTEVVSVWGATHPYAGFLGWNQKLENAIQVDLPCRPCSIYGNKPCSKGDYPCLNTISPEDIAHKVLSVAFDD